MNNKLRNGLITVVGLCGLGIPVYTEYRDRTATYGNAAWKVEGQKETVCSGRFKGTPLLYFSENGVCGAPKENSKLVGGEKHQIYTIQQDFRSLSNSPVRGMCLVASKGKGIVMDIGRSGIFTCASDPGIQRHIAAQESGMGSR